MMTKIYGRAMRVLRHSGLIRTGKDSNPVKWGIIGLGYMAETFATAIDGNRGGTVHAVASRSIEKARRFAANHGRCRAYGSYESMIADPDLDLDVVYIATPVKCHYGHIKLCLEAGKNVLCEKPVTSNSEQLEELMEIARKKRLFFMEGMWMKCLPTFRKAAEWIASGAIGSLELVRADFYKREHIRAGHAIYSAEDGGGVLRDFGVYALAFMTHFLGDAPRIIGATCRKSPQGLDSDWQIAAENNGVRALVNLSSDFGAVSKASVIGTKGFIEWDSPFNRTNRICRYDASGFFQEEFKTSYKFEGFEFEVNEAQRCIRENRIDSDCVPLEASKQTMRVIDRLWEFV